MKRLLLAALLLAAGPAHAAEDDDDELPGAPPGESDDGEPASTTVVDEPPPKRWGGLIIPLIGATTTDGFGVGLGGEVFRRPADGSPGYDLKITPSIYFNVRFDYTNDFLRIDYRRPDGTEWLAQLGFQAWTNLAYAGVGGEDVILDRGADEVGNRFSGPYGFVSLTRPIRDSDLSLIAQVYFRGAWVQPASGRLLDREQPFGVEGGVYSDATLGIASQETDRWPMPHRGHLVTLTGRAGGTVSGGRVEPLVGAQTEAMAWHDLIEERLVIAGRILASKTLGERPFFEQDKAGGRWRDELGSEQALAGYGRTRTRGDGALAALVEVRPHLFRIRKGSFDLAFHLSLTGEWGWLFDEQDLGPSLPTVGVGLPLLWQEVVQLRPFVAWGWRRAEPGDPRRPGLQVGISLLDAL